jgi:hypothetical protein
MFNCVLETFRESSKADFIRDYGVGYRASSDVPVGNIRMRMPGL